MTVDELDSRVMELESLNGTSDNVADDLKDLDTRLSKLEPDGTVAFHAAVITIYPIVPIGTVVIFDQMNLNLGNGFDNNTGEFVVPSDGAGLYFVCVHVGIDDDEYVTMTSVQDDVTIIEGDIAEGDNGVFMCQPYEDNTLSGDYGASSCGAFVVLEGLYVI